VPYTVFITLSWPCRKTETQARAQGHNVAVAKIPLAAIPRAKTPCSAQCAALVHDCLRRFLRNPFAVRSAAAGIEDPDGPRDGRAGGSLPVRTVRCHRRDSRSPGAGVSRHRRDFDHHCGSRRFGSWGSDGSDPRYTVAADSFPSFGPVPTCFDATRLSPIRPSSATGLSDSKLRGHKSTSRSGGSTIGPSRRTSDRQASSSVTTLPRVAALVRLAHDSGAKRRARAHYWSRASGSLGVPGGSAHGG